MVATDKCHYKHNDGGSDNDVCIVGYSVRAPGCSNPTEFAEALREGKDLTTSNTRYPSGFKSLPPRQGRLKEEDITSRFDAKFFGLSMKQAEAMDPCIRLMLQVSYEALMDAQVDIQGELKGSNTGVYVGHCFGDALAYNISGANTSKNGYEIVNGAHSMTANRLSYFYGLHGPSMTLDTACSSSLVALDRAAKDMAAGIIDRAIVGGISLTLNPNVNEAFHSFQMLSPMGHCYTFDTRANGYCRSDGIACVILEPGTIGYAQVAGSGTNSDGAKLEGITYPSANMQAQLISSVLARAKLEPSQVSYHEAHGTGTQAGDREELEALSRVHNKGKQPLIVGAVKSNMGHSEGASGLIGVIKILLMMEDEELYPNHDFQTSPHAVINEGRFLVAKERCPWKPGPCSISSMGFGGSNAYAVLTPCQARQSVCTTTSTAALPFSACPNPMNPPTLLQQYKEFYALQRAIGNHHVFRNEWRDNKWGETSPLVFVCNGQGSQWNHMGKDLMTSSHVFRATMERLTAETKIPFIDLYEDGTSWMKKEYAVLGIVSFQLGLLAVLESHGIRPDMFLGHSLGEIVCAYLAGLQTEAEVVSVAEIRSKLTSNINPNHRLDIYDTQPEDGHDFELLESSSGNVKYAKSVPIGLERQDGVQSSFTMRGKMTVFGCEADLLQTKIEELGLGQTCVAAYNSTKGQTISGPQEEVDILVQEMMKVDSSLFIRDIPTANIAYHAPYLEVFRMHLKKQFEWVTTTKALPSSSWKSTSRGSVFGADYLVNNICGPVFFQEAVESLPKHSTVVEIGPASGLLTQIRRTRKDLTLVGLAERDKPVDLDKMLQKLGSFQRSSQNNTTPMVTTSPSTRLHYSERYPDLWGSCPTFSSLRWQDFEPRQQGGSNGASSVVRFDLTKAPWSSIRDHVIRGQNLFPAAGFLYVLWSVEGFEANVEVLDFKVLSPLVLAEDETVLELCVFQAGESCEIWDKQGEVCHASGRVRPTPATACPPSSIYSDENKGMECEYFYSSIRRLGYEFGPQYRLLDSLTERRTKYKSKPKNWISYLDAFFQGPLFEKMDEQFCMYPLAARRIVLWDNNLDQGCQWIETRGPLSFVNGTVSMEGIRPDYVPLQKEQLPVYSEAFLEYRKHKEDKDPALVASLLAREAPMYKVEHPIESSKLLAIIACLEAHPAIQESDSEIDVVISDRVGVAAHLLVTADDKSPANDSYHFVAQWGDVRLYRCKNGMGKLAVIDNWKNVPKEKPFIWNQPGSSGAAASLYAERQQHVISYESGGSCEGIVGLEKGMRHNFLQPDGRHGIWVDQPHDSSKQETTQETARCVSLEIGRPGVLESLRWSPIDPHRHTIQVHAAAMNFRDVMRAMGKLKESDLSLGHEFSGVVIETGQRVFGIAPNAMSTHCSSPFSCPTPDNISDNEAVTIPLVYLTCYYAMFHIAKMKQGQSILIHGGTGGVGLAAIRLALRRGIQVFATCSNEKREYLKDFFGLEDEQIGDSRSEAFVETVLNGTNGRGVDVILNQLSGNLQTASLRCLAPFGHFCEIGKYDILQNTGLSQAMLEANASFHVIDILPMLRDKNWEALLKGWLEEGFRSNEIVPLPFEVFDATDAVDAFRYMSQAKHKGKIVLSRFNECVFPVTQSQRTVVQNGGVELITGGLGGLGLSVAFRLVQSGCRHLALVGRKGATNNFQRHYIQKMEAMGCRVEIIKSSVLELNSSLLTADVTRIWHIATAYEDMEFEKMTDDAWNAVVQTKVGGYERLRKCWLSTPIVAVSSVVAYFGNARQTNYALANAHLDTLARRDCNNTVTIRLGTLDNVGFITKNAAHRKLFDNLPFRVMPIDLVLDRLLEIATENRSGVFGVYQFKTMDSSSASNSMARGGGDSYTLEHTQTFLARVLGGSPDHYPPSLALKEAGLDSLSTIEVVHHINEHSSSSTFKASQISSAFTVQNIVDYIAQQHAIGGKVPERRPSAAAKRVSMQSIEDDDINNNHPAGDDKSSRSIRFRHQSSVSSSAELQATSQGGQNHRNGSSRVSFHVEDKKSARLDSTSSIMNHLSDPEQPLSSSTFAEKHLNQHSKQQQQQGSSNDVWSRTRKGASVVLFMTTVWWIASLAAFDKDRVEMTLLYALVSYQVCACIRFLVDWLVKVHGAPVKDIVSCCHYLQGCTSFLVYAILAAVDLDVFINYWGAVYFGFYVYDNVALVLHWDSTTPAFRNFYVVHHAISFVLTGCWRIPADEWGDRITIAICLWLTSEFWQYSLLLFRHFTKSGRLSRSFILNAQIVMFVLERIQRIMAYVVALVPIGGDQDQQLPGIALLVLLFGTGIIMDVFDCIFQVKAIRLLMRSRRSMSSLASSLDISSSRQDLTIPTTERIHKTKAVSAPDVDGTSTSV